MPQPHGTINRYNNQRCRCDACREAIRIYRREQRSRDALVAREQQTPPKGLPSVPLATSVAPPVTIEDGRGARSYRIARASCGHELWFSAGVVVPLGGWVRCPEHGPTGVREMALSESLSTDMRAGALLPKPVRT